MKLHPSTVVQIQLVIPDGRSAAVEAYYSGAIHVGHKAEMSRCVVELKYIARGVWLTVWPQTGDAKNPETHYHLGRGCWLTERAA